MTTTLADLERLEFTIIDAQSRSDCTAVQYDELAETLQKVRNLKREYLREHSSVLRKLSREPSPKDRPNAAMPDAMLGSDSGPLAFRAPPELRDLTIVTVNGTIHVPAHGVVETNPDHTVLHAELRGRGFKQLHSVDRFGKSATGADLAQMFERDALQPIAGNLLKALANRAEKASAAPFETRQENFDGSQPGATAARSCEEFRRRYYYGLED